MKSMYKYLMLLAAVAVVATCAQVFAADDEPTAPPPPPPARERTAGAPGMAAGGGGMRGMFGAASIWQFVPRLELTEEQKTKVQAIQEGSQEKVQATWIAIRTATSKLNDLAIAGATEADIRAAATEVGKAYGDQAVLQATTTKEVKALLTAEQKTKLDELIKEAQAQMAERMNRMRGGQRQGQGQGPEGRQGRQGGGRPGAGQQ